MTTDHSEFIARHHRMTGKALKPKKPKRMGYVLLFSVITLCVLVCSYVVFMTDIRPYAVIFSGGVFIAAAMIGFYLQRLIRMRLLSSRKKQLVLQVLEGSRGARLITDSAENTVYCNQKYLDLCGDDHRTLEALSNLFEKNEEALAHFRYLADQAFRGLTDSIEIHTYQEDHETWYQITAQPISGWAGYIHWRIDDITEQRSVDRSIREEREKLIDFTDNAPVGFFSVDEDGRFMFVNATLARWLGDDIQTILSGRNLHTYFEKVPEGAKPYDIIPDGGPKQMTEAVMKGPGGRTFSASISQAVVHEASGVVRTRGVVHDLTAERAMYQALQMSEDRFQRFFEEAPLGITILNEEGALTDSNPALAKLLEYSPSELEGKSLTLLLHDEDRDSTLGYLERVEIGNEKQTPVEITLQGKHQHVSVQMFARRLEGSERIVLHFIDLTQQKVLEQQFVQSQKMQAIGQLAGGVAHDFNNLLTAMIGFCDLLLLRHKPGDPSFSDIMQIKQNSNRAANLVRQLLAFSRQQTLRPKVHDITDILSEVGHLIRRLIGAGIELEMVHGDNLGLVKIDVGQMEQVLINLAVNARDAMNGDGNLVIKTENYTNRKPTEFMNDTMPEGHWVSICVIDTGSGISPENMSRILEPFFTTKGVGEGTGLGLATVYGIVRQTGGYLNIESELGKGTSFTIYLPRANESEEESAPEEIDPEDETRDLTGTARILLVEDEDAVRTFSSRALGNKGYEVLSAESGEAALEVLEKEGVDTLDLLVTDVIMPNMDGPTLAQRVRQQNGTLKIIYISGYTEEKLKDHMGENIWFLAKPFTLKQLAAKVKEALGD